MIEERNKWNWKDLKKIIYFICKILLLSLLFKKY